MKKIFYNLLLSSVFLFILGIVITGYNVLKYPPKDQFSYKNIYLGMSMGELRAAKACENRNYRWTRGKLDSYGCSVSIGEKKYEAEAIFNDNALEQYSILMTVYDIENAYSFLLNDLGLQSDGPTLKELDQAIKTNNLSSLKPLLWADKDLALKPGMLATVTMSKKKNKDP